MRTCVVLSLTDDVQEMGQGEAHIYFSPLHARPSQRSPVQFMFTDEWRT